MRKVFERLYEKHKLLENFVKMKKVFDQHSIEKLNFLLFLEKLLPKAEPSEITSFFYNNFFFGFGGISLFPLGYAPGLEEANESSPKLHSKGRTNRNGNDNKFRLIFGNL